MAYSFQNKNSNAAVTVGEMNQVVNSVELPYKKYVALLTQSGTDAPVATVLENTIGDIVWTRLNTGEYLGTLTGAFSANKTWSSITTCNFGTNSCAILGITRNSANEVYISTVDPTTAPYYTDDFLYQSPIEIRVYN